MRNSRRKVIRYIAVIIVGLAVDEGNQVSLTESLEEDAVGFVRAVDVGDGQVLISEHLLGALGDQHTSRCGAFLDSSIHERDRRRVARNHDSTDVHAVDEQAVGDRAEQTDVPTLSRWHGLRVVGSNVNQVFFPCSQALMCAKAAWIPTWKRPQLSIDWVKVWAARDA